MRINWFEYWMGWRYIRSKKAAKKDGFISLVSLISMSAIALGVLVLMVVLSVMNGFQKEVRDKMLQMLPHIELYSYSNGSQYPALDHWQSLLELAKQQPGVVSGAPYSAGQGMMMFREQMMGTQVQGIDPQYVGNVSQIASFMRQGQLSDLTPGSFNVILGSRLANSLGVRVGGNVIMLIPEGNLSPAGFTPRLRQLKVVGIFFSDQYAYDSAFAYMNVEDVAKLFRTTGTSGLQLKIDDMLKANQISANLGAELPRDVFVQNWTVQNQEWFNAVKLEKRMMTLLLGSIICISAFNLLSSLVMTVNSKRSDIAILRTMGVTRGQVRRIFMLQGVYVGLIGTGIGFLAGVFLAPNIGDVINWFENLFGMKFISAETYIFDRLPSEMLWSDVSFIVVLSVGLSFLATIYPSARAARLQPAEALRYE